MVGINPSIKYQKLNFGAYDTAETQTAMMPADISDDPYADKHGTKLKKTTSLFSLPNLKPKKMDLMPQHDYDEYLSGKSEQPRKKSSFLKPLIILGVITAGGILAYKKRSTLINLFKKEASTGLEEAPQIIGLKTTPKLVGNGEFKGYLKNLSDEMYLENPEIIKPQNFKVIMQDLYTADNKRELLDNFIKLGKMYNLKNYQPRITFILSEAADDATARAIIKKVAEGGKLKDATFEKYFEGIEIRTGNREHLGDKGDMIFDARVRHMRDANEPQDTASRYMLILKEAVKRYL